MSLDDYRKHIDRIDDAIVDLLNERYAWVEKIKIEKEKTGKEIHDPTREEAALQRMEKALKEPLSNEMLREIYTTIFACSKRIQRRD